MGDLGDNTKRGNWERRQRDRISWWLTIVSALVAVASLVVQLYQGVEPVPAIVFAGLFIVSIVLTREFVLKRWASGVKGAKMKRDATILLAVTGLLNSVVVVYLIVSDPPGLGRWTFALVGIWLVVTTSGIAVARSDPEARRRNRGTRVLLFRASMTVVGMSVLTLAAGNVGLAVRDREDFNLALTLTVQAVVIGALGASMMTVRKVPTVRGLVAVGLALLGFAVGAVNGPHQIYGVNLASLGAACLLTGWAAAASRRTLFGMALALCGAAVALLSASAETAVSRPFSVLYAIASCVMLASSAVILWGRKPAPWRPTRLMGPRGRLIMQLACLLSFAGSVVLATYFASIQWINMSVASTALALAFQVLMPGGIYGIIPDRYSRMNRADRRVSTT